MSKNRSYLNPSGLDPSSEPDPTLWRGTPPPSAFQKDEPTWGRGCGFAKSGAWKIHPNKGGCHRQGRAVTTIVGADHVSYFQWCGWGLDNDNKDYTDMTWVWLQMMLCFQSPGLKCMSDWELNLSTVDPNQITKRTQEIPELDSNVSVKKTSSSSFSIPDQVAQASNVNFYVPQSPTYHTFLTKISTSKLVTH